MKVLLEILMAIALVLFPAAPVEGKNFENPIFDGIKENKAKEVAPPTPVPAPIPTVSAPKPVNRPTRTVNSTAYCLTGTMANGQRVHQGSVAMNGVPFGTRFKVLTGPQAGRVFTVKDRIGHSSGFDIWFPSCRAAINYGRRNIQIERV